jgi:hypothetical protein
LYRAALCNVPEGSHLHNRRENLKSHQDARRIRTGFCNLTNFECQTSLFHSLLKLACLDCQLREGGLGAWYSGRKITESLGNVTVRGGEMERARGERDCQQSV